MSTLPADTWHSRDFPVLCAVVRLSDERFNGFIGIDEVVTATGLSVDDVTRAGLALSSDNLVKTIGDGAQIVSDFREPSARARRLTGSWPTPETALDRMIAALEQIAEHTDDADTRTRARKLLDGLTGASRTVALAAATAAVTGQIPS